MKTIFYFSFLILISAFFLTPGAVSAQLGDCTYTPSPGTSFTSSNVTQQNCTSGGGVWSAAGGGSQAATGAFCPMAANPDFQDLIKKITCVINNSIIPLIFSVAVVSFVYGVVQYVINDADESKKDHGRQFMIWGIVALAVMISVWGLVKIVGNTFGIQYAVPQLQTSP